MYMESRKRNLDRLQKIKIPRAHPLNPLGLFPQSPGFLIRKMGREAGPGRRLWGSWGFLWLVWVDAITKFAKTNDTIGVVRNKRRMVLHDILSFPICA